MSVDAVVGAGPAGAPPVVDASAPALSPSLSTRLARIGRAVVPLVVAGAAAFVLWRNWGQVWPTLEMLSPARWVCSLLAALAAMACATRSWQVVFDGLGTAMGLRRAAPIFLVGQLGKYLPGSVWAYVLQAELGRRSGVSRVRVIKATVVSSLVAVVAALVLGTMALSTVIAGSTGLGILRWAYLLIPVCGVVLHPRVLQALVDAALRLLRKPDPTPPVSLGRTARSLGWAVASYLLFGVHLWVLALSVPGVAISDLATCIGTMACAMIAGLFVLILPSGIGVREMVMYAGLAPVTGPGPALALTAASRVLLTLGDLLVAGGSALLAKKGLRA